MVYQIKEEISRFVYTVFLPLNSLSQAIRMSSTAQVQGGTLHMGNLFPAFEGAEAGQNDLLGTDHFLVTLMQNEKSIRVVCFGRAFPEPHQEVFGDG